MKKYIVKNKEDSLGYLTNRAGSEWLKTIREKIKKAGVEIPPEQMMILFQLWEKDGINQKTLVEGSFKDKGTITRGIHSLEKHNLVVRITDENDKRHKKLYLTNKGKDMEKVAKPLAYETHTEALKGISNKDLENCKKVLKKIYENLK